MRRTWIVPAAALVIVLSASAEVRADGERGCKPTEEKLVETTKLPGEAVCRLYEGGCITGDATGQCTTTAHPYCGAAGSGGRAELLVAGKVVATVRASSVTVSKGKDGSAVQALDSGGRGVRLELGHNGPLGGMKWATQSTEVLAVLGGSTWSAAGSNTIAAPAASSNPTCDAEASAASSACSDRASAATTTCQAELTKETQRASDYKRECATMKCWRDGSSSCCMEPTGAGTCSNQASIPQMRAMCAGDVAKVVPTAQATESDCRSAASADRARCLNESVRVKDRCVIRAKASNPDDDATCTADCGTDYTAAWRECEVGLLADAHRPVGDPSKLAGPSAECARRAASGKDRCLAGCKPADTSAIDRELAATASKASGCFPTRGMSATASVTVRADGTVNVAAIKHANWGFGVDVDRIESCIRQDFTRLLMTPFKGANFERTLGIAR